MKRSIPEGLFTRRQAADQIGVNVNTLFTWEKVGKVAKPLRGSGNRVLYSQDLIDAAVAFKNITFSSREECEVWQANGYKMPVPVATAPHVQSELRVPGSNTRAILIVTALGLIAVAVYGFTWFRG